MRKQINENPVVQAAIIGVLALVVGLMLVMRMGGSSDPAAEAPATDPTAAAATDPATGAATDPAATTDPAAGAAATPETSPASPAGSAPAPSTAGGGSDLEAGPGLPREVAEAYDNYKAEAVVLLIVDEDGIDDRRLKTMVEALRSNPGAEVFLVNVKDVADYSRITEGVDVDRTPALVILRPKALTEGPTPTAVVSYGYRGTVSVRQALEDALYNGPSDLPYYPR
jgi:hypothetical protein